MRLRVHFESESVSRRIIYWIPSTAKVSTLKSEILKKFGIDLSPSIEATVSLDGYEILDEFSVGDVIKEDESLMICYRVKESNQVGQVPRLETKVESIETQKSRKNVAESSENINFSSSSSESLTESDTESVSEVKESDSSSSSTTSPSSDEESSSEESLSESSTSGGEESGSSSSSASSSSDEESSSEALIEERIGTLNGVDLSSIMVQAAPQPAELPKSVEIRNPPLSLGVTKKKQLMKLLHVKPKHFHFDNDDQETTAPSNDVAPAQENLQPEQEEVVYDNVIYSQVHLYDDPPKRKRNRRRKRKRGERVYDDGALAEGPDGSLQENTALCDDNTKKVLEFCELSGDPEPGMTLGYTVLEMGPDYQPQFSSKVSKVIEYDAETKRVTFERDVIPDEPGKFDLLDEEPSAFVTFSLDELQGVRRVVERKELPANS